MTTLQERRAWMRKGCPVPAEGGGKAQETGLGGRCRLFEVAVMRSLGRLAVFCKGCNEVRESGSMALGEPAGGVYPVSGATLAVIIACGYMARHAVEGGMPSKEAQHVYEGEAGEISDHRFRMVEWAVALMRGEPEPEDGGRVGPADIAKQWIWLRENPHEMAVMGINTRKIHVPGL